MMEPKFLFLNSDGFAHVVLITKTGLHKKYEASLPLFFFHLNKELALIYNRLNDIHRVLSLIHFNVNDGLDPW